MSLNIFVFFFISLVVNSKRFEIKSTRMWRTDDALTEISAVITRRSLRLLLGLWWFVELQEYGTFLQERIATVTVRPMMVCWAAGIWDFSTGEKEGCLGAGRVAIVVGLIKIIHQRSHRDWSTGWPKSHVFLPVAGRADTGQASAGKNMLYPQS